MEPTSDSLLIPGQRIAAYKVGSRIGRGGMGEVYRAHDERLDRSVAIKVLNPRFSDDPAFRNRFQREARVLASLNHVHIAAIYGLEESGGRQFLVMEWLPGETLAERISRGKLPVHEAIHYGRQIADALAATHARGVIHRDLKPGNVMIVKSAAKVLDFGLAKSVHDETLTAADVVMGTPAYMAPEQRAGKECDARTDIYALGLILYEMVTGVRLVPNQTGLTEPAPSQLAYVIQRCVAAEPENRWQSAQDLKAALEMIAVTPARDDAPGNSISRRWLIGAAAVGALAGAAGYWLRRMPPHEAFKFSITPPEGTSFRHISQAGAAAPSPDGSRIAFATEGRGGPSIWVQSLDGFSIQAIAGTEGGGSPFWSPDGNQLGFFSAKGIQKIDLQSGQTQLLAAASGNATLRSATWNGNGLIVYLSAFPGSVLGQISSSGGDPTVLTKRSVELLDENHTFPFFLPDGEDYLFSVRGGPELDWNVWLGTVKSNDRTLLLEGATKAQYAPPRAGAPGYVVFARNGNLWAQAFEPDDGAPSGQALLIAENVGNDFAVSSGGVLTYRTEIPSPHELIWFDRNGKEAGTIGDRPGSLRPSVRISPDGNAIAFTRLKDGTHETWVHDRKRNVSFPVTLNGRTPAWSPDGSQIAFVRNDTIYRIPVAGGGEEKLVWKGPHLICVNDWSGDGKHLLVTRWDDVGVRQIWLLPDPSADGGKKEPVLFTNGIHAEFVPAVGTPRFVVYDDNGRTQIRSMPGEVAFTRPISADFSNGVRARRDGREFFFASNSEFHVVKMDSGPASITAPQRLFPMPRAISFGQGQYAQGYDVSADGSMFVASFPAPDTPAAAITVIRDWQLSLRK